MKNSKKVNESFPMVSNIDLDRVQQEIWENCKENDVEIYFSEVRRIQGGNLGCSFEVSIDNFETIGNLSTVGRDKLRVKIVEESPLEASDIDTVADYIINVAHDKAAAAGINEDYNGSFDTTSFIDAVNNFGVSRKRWLDFIENEAKKFIRKKEAVWEKEGWSPEDALVYGLERCDDVSYDGFDIMRDEYDGILSSLKFYIENKPKNESLQAVNEKYYLTWYTEEEEGGPEEGGWSRRVWDVKKSYPFSSKEEAINYFNNEVVEDGDTVKEVVGGWRIKDGYGDEHLFEIETDATRGQSHEGPRSWEMYELGYKNPVPKFDSKGNRIYESADGSKRNEKKEIKHKIWELVRDFVDDNDDKYWRFDRDTSLGSPEEVKLVRSIDEMPKSAKYKFTVFDKLKDVASFYYDYQNEDKDYGCWYVVGDLGDGFEGTGMSEKDIHNLSYDDMKKMGIYDESLNENWCDEKLDELREKGQDNWTQEDWEAYAYCKNANAERDYEDMYNPDIYDYDPMMLEDPAEPSVYEDDYEVWEVEEPDLIDDYEIEEEPTDEYKLVDRKTVYDSSGFTTDYSWYVDKNGHHVFVFGDSDLYRPEDGEYDWEEDNEEVAREWFDNYKGFEEEEEDSEEYWS